MQDTKRAFLILHYIVCYVMQCIVVGCHRFSVVTNEYIACQCIACRVFFMSTRAIFFSRIPYPPVNASVLAKRQVVVVKVFDAFFKTLFQHSAEREIRYA